MPQVGRFTAEDPHWHTGNMVFGDEFIKLPNAGIIPSFAAMDSSKNLYGYASSNPLQYVDKDGEIIFIPIIAGISKAVKVVAGTIVAAGKVAPVITTAAKVVPPIVAAVPKVYATTVSAYTAVIATGTYYLKKAITATVASMMGSGVSMVGNVTFQVIDNHLNGRPIDEISRREIAISGIFGGIVGGMVGWGASVGRIVIIGGIGGLSTNLYSQLNNDERFDLWDLTNDVFWSAIFARLGGNSFNISRLGRELRTSLKDEFVQGIVERGFTLEAMARLSREAIIAVTDLLRSWVERIEDVVIDCES